MRLLVTGGCGFVGSNFVRYVLQHYGPEMITNVDVLSTGRLVNLEGVAEAYGDRYEFLHADLADADKMEAVLAQHQFFAVVHAAAERCGPEATASLLDRARHHGIRRFLLVSTDREDSTLPQAEKHLQRAYREFGQEVVITRSTANYGPFQPPPELIPNIILHALRDQPVPVPGDGSGVRDWVHVEDHCAALFTALLDGQPGATYHIQSGHELRDIDLAHQILEQLGKSRELVRFAPEQRGTEDRVAAPAPPEPLAWKPRNHPAAALRATIDWYVRNREWWEPLMAD